MKRLEAIALEGFQAIKDHPVVSVVVAGFELWDVQKAAELIQAAPLLYDALVAASAFLHAAPNDGYSPEFDALLLKLREAEAAAKGATMRRAK